MCSSMASLHSLVFIPTTALFSLQAAMFHSFFTIYAMTLGILFFSAILVQL